MRKIVILIVVASLAILAWLVWSQRRPQPFTVSGFIEADEVRVGSRVGGRVAEVLVEEGDIVKPGQALFRLDPFDLHEQLARAKGELAAAQAEHERLVAGFRTEEIEQARARRDRFAALLAKLVAGPRAQEIEVSRQNLAEARAELEWAQREHQRVAGLREARQAGDTEWNLAERSRKAAEARAQAAAQQLALLEEGTRAEEIAEAQANLAEAEQALQLAERGFRKEDIARAAAQVEAARGEAQAIGTRLAEMEVVSPCDCTVEVFELRPGDLVSANAPAVALLDRTRLWVRAYVPEMRLGQVGPGMAVPARVDGFGEERFAGRISYVATQAEFTPRNVQTPEERSKQVFRIKVMVDDAARRLRPGMSADVLFDEASGP